MKYEIVELPKNKWKHTPIYIKYTTNEYYDLEINESKELFDIKMEKKRFLSLVTHSPEEYDYPDRLYQDFWEEAKAYGIVIDNNGKEELLACVEVWPEEWSNRLRITILWVDDYIQSQGVGTMLMNYVKEIARLQNRRAIILETQSCNVKAIDFYRKQGFELIGFDKCCYTNNDIERCEFRLEFGYFLNRNPDRR